MRERDLRQSARFSVLPNSPGILYRHPRFSPVQKSQREPPSLLHHYRRIRFGRWQQQPKRQRFWVRIQHLYAFHLQRPWRFSSRWRVSPESSDDVWQRNSPQTNTSTDQYMGGSYRCTQNSCERYHHHSTTLLSKGRLQEPYEGH